MLKYAVAAIALLATTPAVAQITPIPEPAQPQTATPPGQKVDPLDKMVCRYEETLGTRLGRHKVCATLREWKDQQDENRGAAEKIQQQGYGIPQSG
jgi:hypothetical protein